MAEEFDVDISPRDLVFWVKADQARRSPTVWASASKTVEKRDIELEAARVTLEDDVAETVTRGILEARPRRGAGGWALWVRVDDQAGEHRVNDEDTEQEEELAVEAFEEEFLLPENRPVDITVSVEDGGAQLRFRRWLRRTLSRQFDAKSPRRLKTKAA